MKPSHPFEGPRRSGVLVVEDDPVYRELLQMALGFEGFRVRLAENGARAIEELESGASEVVDAIVLDLLMPVMDGLRFLRWLRDDAKSDLPVLVVTSVDSRALSVETRVAGATEVLVKPVALEKLLARLEVLCRRGAISRLRPIGASFDVTNESEALDGDPDAAASASSEPTGIARALAETDGGMAVTDDDGYDTEADGRRRTVDEDRAATEIAHHRDANDGKNLDEDEDEDENEDENDTEAEEAPATELELERG